MEAVKPSSGALAWAAAAWHGATAAVGGLAFLLGAGVVLSMLWMMASELIKRENGVLALILLVPAALYSALAAYGGSIVLANATAAKRIVRGEASPRGALLTGNGPVAVTALTACAAGLVFVAVRQRGLVVERARVAEALQAVERLRSAQTAHLERTGAYSASTGALAVDLPLRFFELGPLRAEPGPSPRWSVSLRRNERFSNVQMPYGTYEISFDSSRNPSLACAGGNDPARCSRDLLQD